MSSNESRNGRARRALIALATVTGTAAILAAPASAASGQGSASIALASHDKGRTLSGQGVRVLAGAPATKADSMLTLPISEVDPSGSASATTTGSLRFKRGKRSVWLTGIRFDLGTGALSGKLGKDQTDVFKLGAAPSVNATTGAVSLDSGKLRLTADGAQALRDKLGLERALVHKGVGAIWLSAKADPTREAAKAVTSGAANWGFLTSWRFYVLTNFTPVGMGPSDAGTITTSGGATANGDLPKAGAYFGLPAAGGNFEKGLYGATDKLVLKTAGAVKFAKPMHCINEIKLSDMVVTLDGPNSSIVSGFDYDVDKFNGMGCDPVPSVSAPGTTIATLDPSGVTPAYAADGKTVTWTGVPAALTGTAAAVFGSKYKAGQPLDPVTITVGLG